ncbi:MAG: HlyD family efflux transporter periplasmic adaptor subunit [Gammaproteobacteria bacterium]
MDKPRISICAKLFIVLIILTGCSQQDEIHLQGYADADFILLSPTFSGVLKERLVQRGDKVVAGQLLYVLDPQPQMARLAQAQSQLRAAQSLLSDISRPLARKPEIEAFEARINQAIAQRNLARERVERARNLYRDGYIDEDSLEANEAAYTRSEEGIKQYQAELRNAQQASRTDQIEAQEQIVSATEAQTEEAQWALLQKKQYAPAAGVIFDTFFDQGENIPGGQSVLALLPPENIYLVFFLPEPLLNRVSYGQEIEVECDGCVEPSKAKVYYISPQAEYTPPVVFSRENSAKYVFRIKAIPQQPADFHPGQPVYITIRVQQEASDDG